MNARLKDHFAVDIWMIAASVVFAVFLVKSGILQAALGLSGDSLLLSSFVAGLFFTSVFTTAPAIAALGLIAQSSASVWPVALVGGIGALIGDLVIYRFLGAHFNRDVRALASLAGNRKLSALFRFKFFRWLTFFLGALVIASPLPDELGLMMMGVSKAKMTLLIPTSFLLNFAGIAAIGFIAKSIVAG